jgi:hypothetical protein
MGTSRHPVSLLHESRARFEKGMWAGNHNNAVVTPSSAGIQWSIYVVLNWLPLVTPILATGYQPKKDQWLPTGRAGTLPSLNY